MARANEELDPVHLQQRFLSGGIDDRIRGHYHWQFDLLRSLRKTNPSSSQLRVFSQLCYWWGRDWERYAFEGKALPRGKTLESVELVCSVSIHALAGWTLGEVSPRQILRAISDLAALGLLVTKQIGLGQSALRIMNRDVIESYCRRWREHPALRETMVTKQGELYIREGRSWVRASSSCRTASCPRSTGSTCSSRRR